jgi:hypothetical protein
MSRKRRGFFHWQRVVEVYPEGTTLVAEGVWEWACWKQISGKVVARQ